jgi:Flp pilus assembly pilin Flp
MVLQKHVILLLQTPFLRVSTMDFGVNKRALNMEDSAPHASKSIAIEDGRAQTLERLLLLTFIVVAAASVMWHLGMSLQWLWTSCASQLHSAILHSGIA